MGGVLVGGGGCGAVALRLWGFIFYLVFLQPINCPDILRGVVGLGFGMALFGVTRWFLFGSADSL